MESGIAFSLTLAILFSFYRTENPKKKRIVISVSLALGIISGLISQYIRSIPNYVNRANLDFFSVLPIVLAMIYIFVVYLLRKKCSRRRYENLVSVGVVVYTVASLFYYFPQVLSQMNSLVYYGESAVSTMVLFRLIGYLFAIGTIVVSVSAVYAVGKHMRENQLVYIALMNLLIIGMTQINVVVQRLYSLQIIPKNPMLFKIIAFVSNHSNYFYFASMIFLAIAPVVLIRQNIRVTQPYDNPAQLRKIRYLMRRSRRIATFFLFVLVFNIFSLTYVKAYAYADVALSEPEPYDTVDGVVELPLELFEDNKLHRYEYVSAGGKHMRFIVIKKSEGSYGVCLDACEICGPSGYYMREEEVICKLCDVVMNKGTIGFKGGCNPIPLPFMVHDKKVKIRTSDLDAQESVFR